MQQHLLGAVLAAALALALVGGGARAGASPSPRSLRHGDSLPAQLVKSFVRAGARPNTRPAPAHGRSLCVGAGHGCFATIQAALDAAVDGDTVSVGPGVFSGGLTITKSVNLVGVSAAATTIRGGGPVISVGEFFGSSEPTVTITGVTITGGRTRSSPQADLFFGVPGVWAIGGGVYVPPADGFAPGATVTVRDSLITGNTASPTASIGPTPDQEPFWPVCPSGFCPFAEASGGGIASDGNLTLIHTTVSDNAALGPTASDSVGGGIYVGFAGGSLTLDRSTVTGNLAQASDPNGRFVEGGGIFTAFGDTVTIGRSAITRNTSRLTSSFPYFVGGGNVLELGINSGGAHLGEGGSSTIRDSRIDENSVEANVPNGEPEVFDAGLCACGESPLDLESSSVSNNRLAATMQTTADVFADFGFSAGGALEMDAPATVSHVEVTGNDTVVYAPNGVAIANGMIADFDGDPDPVVISDSTITDNTVVARSDTGSAVILGGAILNAGFLQLEDDLIRANAATLRAASGSAQGGGIWNGAFPGGPPVLLSLTASRVTQNSLIGGPGTVLQGGGLFTEFPVTLSGTTIDKNNPDNCSGLSC